MVPRHYGRLLRRLPPLVPRSWLCCSAPLGATFVAHGPLSLWSPPPSAPPARPSLLALLLCSAPGDVRRTWPLVTLVASSVGSPRSSLATGSVAPLRSGRRSPDMVPRHFGRLLRRLPPLVPRSWLCCSAPLRPAFAGHGPSSFWSPPPSAPPARPSLLAFVLRDVGGGLGCRRLLR